MKSRVIKLKSGKLFLHKNEGFSLRNIVCREIKFSCSIYQGYFRRIHQRPTIEVFSHIIRNQYQRSFREATMKLFLVPQY